MKARSLPCYVSRERVGEGETKSLPPSLLPCQTSSNSPEIRSFVRIGERGEHRKIRKEEEGAERENTCYSPPSPFPCERTITKSPLSSFLLPFLPSTDWAVNPGEPFSDRRKAPFLSRCSSKNIILVNSAFLGTDEGIICATYLTVFLYGLSTFY